MLHATRRSFGGFDDASGRAPGRVSYSSSALFRGDGGTRGALRGTAALVDDIQSAVNNVAKKILNASQEIKRWGNTDLNGDEENVPGVDYDNIGTGTFYDEIASDIEIVKLVLLFSRVP